MNRSKIAVIALICAILFGVMAFRFNKAPDHVHTSEWVIINEPGCIEAGLEYAKCVGENGCGEIVEQRGIKPFGHKPSDEWTVIEAPAEESGGIEARLCTVCGEAVETRDISGTGK